MEVIGLSAKLEGLKYKNKSKFDIQQLAISPVTFKASVQRIEVRKCFEHVLPS